MKTLGFYLLLIYVTFCADDVQDWDDVKPLSKRVPRAILWPITVTNWFRIQNSRLFRFLHIIWVMLITGWLLSLIQDKFLQ